MKLTLLFLLFIQFPGVGLPVFRQTIPAEGDKNCKVLFWNLENLFITSQYFYKKINSIAKHIYISSEGNLPVLIGVSEIENFQVVWRLTNLTSLAQGGYGIVHRDSPDHRGIDVALLYRKDRFKLLNIKYFAIKNEIGDTMRTRYTLYAKGVLDHLDTLHIVVLHWPSKWGGERASAPGRVASAKVLNSITDSVLALNRKSNIVAMGDFNEQSGGSTGVASMVNSLNLIYPIIRRGGRDLKGRVKGTIKYNGRWEIIDHFLVSSNLLNKKEPVFCTDTSVQIYTHPLLIESDRTYLGIKPKRSFLGPRYNGGISDHLPIILTIKRSW